MLTNEQAKLCDKFKAYWKQALWELAKREQYLTKRVKETEATNLGELSIEEFKGKGNNLEERIKKLCTTKENAWIEDNWSVRLVSYIVMLIYNRFSIAPTTWNT